MSDDGIGIKVIENLKDEKLPNEIEIIDGGTSVFDMLKYFTDYKHIIIIDALKGGHEAGTVYKLTPDKISSYSMQNLSLHDVQILEVIKMANIMGCNPRVTIIGIEPKIIKYGTTISETLNNKIPDVINMIKELIIKKS